MVFSDEDEILIKNFVFEVVHSKEVVTGHIMLITVLPAEHYSPWAACYYKWEKSKCLWCLYDREKYTVLYHTGYRS